MLLFFTADQVGPMDTSATESAIMTIGEVAAYLKVTARTIYSQAAAKKIPAFKVGGSWRFSRTDLDAWIRSQTPALGHRGNGS
jgi:excisionase family DNA binding protein